MLARWVRCRLANAARRLPHPARQVTLDRAFAEHPARFINKAPVPFAKPTAAWINRPAPKALPGGPQSTLSGCRSDGSRIAAHDRGCVKTEHRTRIRWSRSSAMSRFVEGEDRQQSWLLPSSLD